MLQAGNLAEEYVKHINGCPSRVVAGSVGAAVEAWFKVELAYLLFRAGFDSVRLDYNYPGTREKADLVAQAPWGLYEDKPQQLVVATFSKADHESTA